MTFYYISELMHVRNSTVGKIGTGSLGAMILRRHALDLHACCRALGGSCLVHVAIYDNLRANAIDVTT